MESRFANETATKLVFWTRKIGQLNEVVKFRRWSTKDVLLYILY